MRPLPTSPTNTFQSPKVATSDGLAGSSFAADLGVGLALVAALAGKRALAAQTAAAASPMARRDRRTRRVITNNPLSRALALWAMPAGGFLPFDPGEIPAFALSARARTAILHLVTE